MKVVTQITIAAPNTRGTRINYAITEIDENGIIVNSGIIDSCIAEGQMLELVNNLIAAVKQKVDEEGNV